MAGVEVTGLRELQVNLRAAGPRVGLRAAAVIRKTAADIERDAKINAPVDTGFLMNSITTTIEGDGRSGSMRAEIGPTAYYGVFVELGTSRNGAQPFLFPAVDKHESRFYEAMAQAAEPEL